MRTALRRRRLKRLLEKIVTDKNLGPVNICWCNDPWMKRTPPSVAHLTDEGPYEFDAQILVHELTHLEIGLGHRANFWEKLEPNVRKYLGVEPDAHQRKMKKDYGIV